MPQAVNILEQIAQGCVARISFQVRNLKKYFRAILDTAKKKQPVKHLNKGVAFILFIYNLFSPYRPSFN